MNHSTLTKLLACGALCCLSSCSMQGIVYPGSQMQMPDAACGYPENILELPATDGTSTLRGWFFNRGPNTPLVVIFGGNAMNVGSMTRMAATDQARSYLLMNYRGFGGSTGEPNQLAIIDDARSCIRYARSAMGNPGAQLYLTGFSLGSAVATHVAIHEQPAGLVLICPFDNMDSVACNKVPFFPRLLPLDPWDSTRVAPQINCPVTIINAKYDQVVPTKSTEKLIKSFRTPPLVHTLEADHNNIFASAVFYQLFQKSLPVNDQCKFDF